MIVLLMVSTILFPGCFYLKHQFYQGDPFRVHPLGMTVYNRSGLDLNEDEWRAIFGDVEFSYRTLVDYAEISDEEVKAKLRGTPIIILPAEPLIFLGKNFAAFTNFDAIFLRYDKFNPPNIRHELIHVHPYWHKKKILGDIPHKNGLFKKCEYILNPRI